MDSSAALASLGGRAGGKIRVQPISLLFGGRGATECEEPNRGRASRCPPTSRPEGRPGDTFRRGGGHVQVCHANLIKDALEIGFEEF